MFLGGHGQRLYSTRRHKVEVPIKASQGVGQNLRLPQYLFNDEGQDVRKIIKHEVERLHMETQNDFYKWFNKNFSQRIPKRVLEPDEINNPLVFWSSPSGSSPSEPHWSSSVSVHISFLELRFHFTLNIQKTLGQLKLEVTVESERRSVVLTVVCLSW